MQEKKKRNINTPKMKAEQAKKCEETLGMISACAQWRPSDVVESACGGCYSSWVKTFFSFNSLLISAISVQRTAG